MHSEQKHDVEIQTCRKRCYCTASIMHQANEITKNKRSGSNGYTTLLHYKGGMGISYDVKVGLAHL